jgi:hypothetical protein
VLPVNHPYALEAIRKIQLAECNLPFLDRMHLVEPGRTLKVDSDAVRKEAAVI